MSNQSSFSNSKNKLKTKMKDSIPYRIEFIKELLHNQSINPLVCFDNTDTEYFIGKNDKDENESGGSYDTRVVLEKKFCDFVSVISQIGDNKSEQLEYVKSGTSGHTFHGRVTKSDGNVFEYGVKVVAYPRKEKYGDMHDIRRPENAELKMLKVLSYFIVKRQTPHLILPIGTFDTKIETFTSSEILDVVGENNEKYQEFLEKYKSGDYFDKVSILLCEWANRGDLLDFLRKNYNSPKFTPAHWKSIFFQILSVLTVIQCKYPAFRHNDLKANNILVHKIPKPYEHLTYCIAKKTYKIKNIGYQLKLWDFDFACIPGIVDNKKVEMEWTKLINVTPTQNRYYDIHYFFNTLIKKGFLSEIMTNPEVPQEVKDFINRVVPPIYTNDPMQHEFKNHIEKILQASNYKNKYKKDEYASKYINGYQLPADIKKYIKTHIHEKYQKIRIGIVHEKGRLLVNDEYTTPRKILEEDPYFDECRVYDSMSNISKISKQVMNVTNTPDIMKFLVNDNMLTKKNSKVRKEMYQDPNKLVGLNDLKEVKKVRKIKKEKKVGSKNKRIANKQVRTNNSEQFKNNSVNLLESQQVINKMNINIDDILKN